MINESGLPQFKSALDCRPPETSRSLIRLSPETVSVHRLLQAVEQDALGKEERTRWLEWAVRLFNAFAPGSPDDVRTWAVWSLLRPHAEALLEQAQNRGVDAPPVVRIANELGLFLKVRADYAQAEPLYRRALAITEQSLGPGHPTVAIRFNNLAGLLQDTNRLAEAEPLYRRAVEIFLQFMAATGHEHPHLRAAISNYAALLEAIGLEPAQIRAQLEKLFTRYVGER